MSNDKIHKTNAMRILDGAGIDYEVSSYTVDENDLSGTHVASEIGRSPDQVFKTLVLEGDKTGNLVCCIPSSQELDLKKVAAASGNKKVEMIPMKSLFELTGYVRGGCTVLGMKKDFPTYFDETALLFDTILISAGMRGQQLTIDPVVIAEFIGAPFVDLCEF